MRLDVYHHFSHDQDPADAPLPAYARLLLERFTRVEEHLRRVEVQGAQLMTQFSDVQSLLAAMNEVTNDLSAKVNVVVSNEASQLALIQSLKDQVAQGAPVSPEQLDQLAADLQARTRSLEAVRDHLASIATNPEAPTGSGSEGLPTQPADPGVPPSTAGSPAGATPGVTETPQTDAGTGTA